MKTKEFIEKVKFLKAQSERSDASIIMEQLERVAFEYAEDHGLTDEDAVLLMEKMLDVDLTKEKNLIRKNIKYDLATILCGNLPTVIKRQLEVKQTYFYN